MSQLTIHSSNETVQTSTSSSSTVFGLEWNTRDNLIQNLNKHSALLHLDQLNEGEKSNVIQETDRLISQLSALFIKLPNPRKRMKLDSTTGLVLEFSWQFRDQLIVHLVANKTYALSVGAFSKDEKCNLIKTNNQLVFKLMSLDVQSDSADGINDTRTNNEGQGRY